MGWAGRYIVLVVSFFVFENTEAFAEFNQWPASPYGYGSAGYSPYGYGQGQLGPNGTPYGYNPYGPNGRSNYPSFQSPEQQMLFGLLAKAKAAVYKSRFGANDLSKTQEQSTQAMGASLESFSKSVAAGQEAMAKAMQPIPEIQLGDAFVAAFTSKDESWRDPLGGLSEQMNAMSQSMLEASKLPDLTKPAISSGESTVRQVPTQPSVPSSQSRPANSKGLLPVLKKRSQPASRGISSIQLEQAAEPTMHRNMHSPLGHAMHGDHGDGGVRVITYRGGE
jgi:hypothetical protein